MVVLAIAGAIGGAPYIWLLVSRAYGFIRSNVLNTSISCKVLRHSPRGQTYSTKIKLAYVGEKPGILNDILVSYDLKLRPPVRGIMAWVNIASGYLVCDMKGLSTILGTRQYVTQPPMVHLWKSPAKYPASVLTGLYFSYFLLLGVLLSPTVIPLIFLLAGPYSRFALRSAPGTMTISYADGRDVSLPTVLNPGDELTLEARYKMGLAGKGFPADTPYRFLSRLPRITIRPPKPGNFAWVGKGSISVLGRRGWGRLRVDLGPTVIVGIGSG